MDLTPVRIRGKKRKPPDQVLPISKSVTHSKPQLPTHTKRRRKEKKQKVATPAMPNLEGLPQELLEIIFLYSENIALPTCSPSLGRKLSSHAVTMEMTMRSFYHTVDHKSTARDRARTSDPVKQTRLLSRRFFTWDYFLKYVARAESTQIKSRGTAWKETSLVTPGIKDFDGLWPGGFTKIPYLGFADTFYIPQKLLQGPWTDDKASFLYVLVAFGGRVNWSDLSGEKAKGGIRSAIQEENERAVAALAVLLGVPNILTTEMLRYAVIDCGCNFSILRHLLFNAQIGAASAPEGILNFLDPQLWTWAERYPEKGIVLKDMLRKADAFDLEFYFEEGADWRKIVSFPYSGYKFDTRTTFNPMNREMLKGFYGNYGRKITVPREHRRTVIVDQGRFPVEL